MRDDLESVLACQPEHDSTYTPAMRRRFELITRSIPRQLRDQADAWDATGRHRVEASDGKGRRALVPWVRVFDPDWSSAPTTGWYVVYLFAASGQRVYLALIQGASAFDRPVQSVLLRDRAAEARSRLTSRLAERPDLVTTLDLASSAKRPRSYVDGTVAAFVYERGQVPDDSILFADLAFLVTAAVELQRGGVTPEIADAVAMVEEVAGRRKRMPRQLTAAQRRAIEMRAVLVVTEHLVEQGYRVDDVGAHESYDLDARRGDERIFVEVKGTTSAGDRVVLTRNEVALHRREYPHTVLAVVSGIQLDSRDEAHGGELLLIRPWQVAEERLVPLAYEYVVPR